MKTTEIRQKNKEQIEKFIHDQREKLKEMMFGSSGSREKNVKLQKTLKKDIARFLTILNEAKKEVVKEIKEVEAKVKKVSKKVSTKK